MRIVRRPYCVCMCGVCLLPWWERACAYTPTCQNSSTNSPVKKRKKSAGHARSRKQSGKSVTPKPHHNDSPHRTKRGSRHRITPSSPEAHQSSQGSPASTRAAISALTHSLQLQEDHELRSAAARKPSTGKISPAPTPSSDAAGVTHVTGDDGAADTAVALGTVARPRRLVPLGTVHNLTREDPLNMARVLRPHVSEHPRLHHSPPSSPQVHDGSPNAAAATLLAGVSPSHRHKERPRSRSGSSRSRNGRSRSGSRARTDSRGHRSDRGLATTYSHSSSRSRSDSRDSARRVGRGHSDNEHRYHHSPIDVRPRSSSSTARPRSMRHIGKSASDRALLQRPTSRDPRSGSQTHRSTATGKGAGTRPTGVLMARASGEGWVESSESGGHLGVHALDLHEEAPVVSRLRGSDEKHWANRERKKRLPKTSGRRIRR